MVFYYIFIQLKSIYVLIGPISTYTDQIQKDNASLYTVWSCFNKLKKNYKSDVIPNEFLEDAELAITIINENWDNHINNKIINVTRLFNFEKKFKPTKEEIAFIEN